MLALLLGPGVGRRGPNDAKSLMSLVNEGQKLPMIDFQNLRKTVKRSIFCDLGESLYGYRVSGCHGFPTCSRYMSETRCSADGISAPARKIEKEPFNER